jgi:tetratricopeptide (TPR) repeat protein
LSTFAPELARSLCALGRHDEAEAWIRLGREVANDQDISSQAYWRQALALVHSSRGEHSEAERLAREALVIAERGDALNTQGDALVDLASVLSAAGRSDDARAVLEQGLDRYERKKNLVMAERIRERLATPAARP